MGPLSVQAVLGGQAAPVPDGATWGVAGSSSSSDRLWMGGQ